MSRRNEYQFDKSPEGAPIVWRSLESKRDPETAAITAKAEFPLGMADNGPVETMPQTAENRGFGRRNFMLFAGASAALFGCARRPVEKIMPYAKQPEQAVPGMSYYYATVREHRGEALGLLVESHEGRPTKIEGNPDHPTSLGSTDALAQATVWDLYDPDRLHAPVRAPKDGKGEELTLKAVDADLRELVEAAKKDQGAKMRVLIAPTNSPTVMRLREAIKGRFASAKVHEYASVNEAEVRGGAKLAFDQVVTTVYDYDKARTIVALDADFLGTEAGNVRAARTFANGRKLRSPSDTMSRLYVVEPSVTVTGLASDHRLRLRAQDIEGYLVALAAELSKKHGIELGPLGSLTGKVPEVPEKWKSAVAKDLAQNKGKALIVVGSRQPARVHALAHAINWALGSAGQCLQQYPAADKDGALSPTQDLKALVADMAAGKVDQLVILGGNPVYDAPSDLKFAEALAKVKTVVHLSTHLNETSRLASLVIPRSHELESWGDQRSLNGTLAIQQPLIQPLHQSRSDIELLGYLANEPSPKALDIVRATMSANGTLVGNFEKAWGTALKKGVVADAFVRPFGGLPPKSSEIAAAFAKPSSVDGNELEVTFAPCPRLFDGRHANNPWMLELPEPVSKLSWDNAAFISPATAKARGLESGDMVRLTRAGATPIEIAVFVLPGQADATIALALGWGRQDCGRYGSKHGFDVHGLRTTETMGFVGGVQMAALNEGDIAAIRGRYADLGKASEPGPAPGRVGPVTPFEPEKPTRYRLVQTQEHGTMEGRPIAIDASYQEYKANPKFPLFPYKDAKDPSRNRGGSPDPKVLPLWEKRHYERDTEKGREQNPTGFKWGMVFDLSACTGCNACVVACQSENNIASVGKEQVMRGRELSWLRLDRYFVGQDENNPLFVMQPVACVQCEEAPCENVCPVNATEHSPEGLNDMAYNRCIGTRYCANNCPYKVRRFNYLAFHGVDGVLPETEKMHMNPNVTIRMRGVMEKCSYCVQRIQEGKIAAKRDGRVLRDGDIVTACQQACPSEAITFGDLNDASGKVAKLRDLDRSYRLLAELGTGPRTTYLGKIRNLNPEMA
jgi:molybdopterin-containing oxidoreductase family iron-sulfur binding subunit